MDPGPAGRVRTPHTLQYFGPLGRVLKVQTETVSAASVCAGDSQCMSVSVVLRKMDTYTFNLHFKKTKI